MIGKYVWSGYETVVFSKGYLFPDDNLGKKIVWINFYRWLTLTVQWSCTSRSKKKHARSVYSSILHLLFYYHKWLEPSAITKQYQNRDKIKLMDRLRPENHGGHLACITGCSFATENGRFYEISHSYIPKCRLQLTRGSPNSYRQV